MVTPPDDRRLIAVAYQWASRIMGVSIEMVVPGLLGFWVDQKLGTWVLFTMLGFSGGMVLGIWHLIAMTRADSSDRQPPRGTTHSP